MPPAREMRCEIRAVVLTQLPWIAGLLVRDLARLGVEVMAIVVPDQGVLDWTSIAETGLRPTFVARGETLDDSLERFRVDALFCWCYPWKIGASALAIPRLGCVNFHPSRLPRDRGPMPLAWALRRGDTEIGVTWHRMGKEYDAGPILAQGAFEFGDADFDFADFGPRIDRAGAALLSEVVSKLIARDAGEEQDPTLVTYAPKFAIDEYASIDWRASSRAIHNQVRAWALTGLGARMCAPLATLDGRTLRVLRTSLTPPDDHAPGVRTADGWIWLRDVEVV